MSDKTILITGGAGYIGSALIRDIANDPKLGNPRVRVFDNLQRHHLYGLLDLPSSGTYEFIEGDILDRFGIERAMEDVDTVIHLAAIVRTPFSFEHPEWTSQVNHWGTQTVVESALQAGVARFIHVSSASVYGSNGHFTENDECKPVGPYAVSKFQAEREVITAGDRGLNATIIRLGTVFGNAPAVRFDAVAGRFVYLACAGKPLTIHGSGEQVRPMIHINDASDFLRHCLTNGPSDGRTVNVAAYHPTVLEIVDTLKRIAPQVITRFTQQDFLTQISYSIDTQTMQALGFEPQTTLQDGLQALYRRLQYMHNANDTQGTANS